MSSETFYNVDISRIITDVWVISHWNECGSSFHKAPVSGSLQAQVNILYSLYILTISLQL